MTWLEAERANIMTLGHLAAGKAHIRWFPILMARILGKYLPFRLEWQDYQTLCTLAKQAAAGPSDLAYAELGLGVAACQTHNIQAGLAHLTTALNLYHAAHDDPGQITALDRIGHAHLLLHRPQNSLEYYRKALDICTRLDDNSHEARVRCNAAWAFYQLNDHATCARYLNQALKIRQQQGDRIAEGVIRGNLGKNYLAANHFPEAIAQLTQALELSIETGNRSCEVDTLNDLYLAHQTVGNTKEGAKIKHRLAVLTTQRP